MTQQFAGRSAPSVNVPIHISKELIDQNAVIASWACTGLGCEPGALPSQDALHRLCRSLNARLGRGLRLAPQICLSSCTFTVKGIDQMQALVFLVPQLAPKP